MLMMRFIITAAASCLPLGSLLAVAAIGLAAGRGVASEAPLEPVLPIAEAVRRGTEGDESGGVRVRGVVTLAYSDNSAFTIQDDSGGIWATTYHQPADSPDRAQRAALQVGDEVEVAGMLSPGGYAPLMLVEELRVVGHGAACEPREADLPRLFRGGDNCRLVSVEGIVRAFRDDGRYDGLLLDVDSRQVLARFPREIPRESVAGLIDATVRVVGVVSAVRNARGEFLCPTLSIRSGADIEVVKEPPGAPLEAPFTSFDRIAKFSGEPLPRSRIRTRGVVSAALPGNVLFLQHEWRGLRVQASVPVEAKPGDEVEVAGYLDMGRQIAGLVEAIVRRVGSGPVPEPRAVTPDEIIAINAAARQKGQIAEPGDFDGCLVTFAARVVEVKPSPSGGGQLVVSSGDMTLPATLDDRSFQRLAGLRTGSEIRATGVIQLQLRGDEGLRSMAADPVVQQMSLLLRSADDVVILREPSWWTPTRLAVLLGTVVSVLAAALVWVVLLRREVRVTTLRLASEIQSRRNAVIEFQATLRERNRLAANLHDTLLQTLRGIDFQLGACQAQGDKPEGDPREYLDVARKMVNHASEELRGSVWALRTMPVAGRSFAESLEAIARQTGHGHAEHVAVRTVGDSFDLPQFVAGNLLLVAQEAIHNALAHADAGQIDVAAEFNAAAGAVEITIVDDGCGFTPGTESGPDQGHFGLTGMRERIDRLGGEFAVDSRPGGGTTVRAKVRKRDYDARVEGADESRDGLRTPQPASQPATSSSTVRRGTPELRLRDN